MVNKVNVLIIGNGHYSTGSTVLEGKKATDKDIGVLLPSVLELKKQGLVDKIIIAARDGRKMEKLRAKIKTLSKNYRWSSEVELFPKKKVIQDNAYIDALNFLPKPGVVLIATPDFLHKRMVIDSIKRGYHFMVVKPIVVQLGDLYEILKLVKKHKVLGLVDYHKVYDEANLILKDQYNSGHYGDIQHIYTKMTQRRDMLDIFSNWAGKYNHNINHYLGSHYIHLVSFITNATPLSVRSNGQYGIVKEKYHINTPDLIETQIEWLSKNNNKFVSYHISGWSDPSETSAMTYQEIHLITTRGHISSDQRYRGFETVLSGEGQRLINPYFFYLNKNLSGSLDLETKYGFKSVSTMVKSAIDIENGKSVESYENSLPTIKDSLKITAILEASDKSLKNKSTVVNLKVSNS